MIGNIMCLAHIVSDCDFETDCYNVLDLEVGLNVGNDDKEFTTAKSCNYDNYFLFKNFVYTCIMNSLSLNLHLLLSGYHSSAYALTILAKDSHKIHPLSLNLLSMLSWYHSDACTFAWQLDFLYSVTVKK